MKGSSLGVATLLLLSACSAIGADTDGQDNARFAHELQHYEQVMAQPRPALEFVDGSQASNCREYLQQRQHKAVPEGVRNRSLSANYRVCPTIQALRHASPSPRFDHPDATAGEILRDRLDLRSFRSSLGPVASRYPTLTQLPDKRSLHVDYNTVTLLSEDWYMKLEVVARADIDHDGLEDWLVWLTDEARNGNYRGYESLVIYGVSGDGLLKAEPVNQATLRADDSF